MTRLTVMITLATAGGLHAGPHGGEPRPRKLRGAAQLRAAEGAVGGGGGAGR